MVSLSLNVKKARAEMNGVNFSNILSLVIATLIVKGSASLSGVKGPPSPPRNLRRKTVGIAGANREYWVFWTASKDNGGLPVNYTLKACSNETHNCKFISNPDCQATNVISTSKTFSCIMQPKEDFLPSCGEYCDFILCVVAFNDAGENEICIFAEVVDAYGGTPKPPLDFRVGVENGKVTVRWNEREAWKYSSSVARLYTVMYSESDKFVGSNKTKEVRNQTLITLSGLEVFTRFCFYLMIQLVDGKKNTRTAHSDVLGPKCLKSPAGDPTSQPWIVAHENFIYPGNASFRNVSVQWKLVPDSSWKGTKYQYRISCEYHIPAGRKPLGNKCLYHTDAGTNKTVLQHLNTADTYNVYMEMCNKEGLCSGRGKSYLVKREEVQVEQAPLRKEEESNKTHIVGISVTVITVAIVSPVLLFFIWKWRRESRLPDTSLAKRLEGLEDPIVLNQYDYVSEKVGNVYAEAV